MQMVGDRVLVGRGKAMVVGWVVWVVVVFCCVVLGRCVVVVVVHVL